MFFLSVYVVIGNSDNKLTQAQWSDFCDQVDDAIRDKAKEIYGEWYSLPNSEYQNACWSFTLDQASWSEALKRRLMVLANRFNQDSIVWAPTQVEFLQSKTKTDLYLEQLATLTPED